MKTKMLVILGGLLLCLMPVAAQDAPVLNPVECPFAMPDGETEGETIQCLMMTVPESRTGLTDATVDLLITDIIPSGDAQVDPVIYFSGGPGGSASSELDNFLSGSMRQYAEILLLEQRGTGYSTPTLNCTEATDGTSDNPEQDCYDRLMKEGVSLASFNSAENSADAADLIAALNAEGVENVNLYGISYGTRLALTVMRNYPEHVHAVIIDGVYPPDVQAYETLPANTVRVFKLMFQQCKEDSECAATFPDLEAVFYKTIGDLNANPLPVTKDTGDQIDLDGSTFLNDIFQVFYDTASIEYIPAAIYAAANGDADSFAMFAYGGGGDTTGQDTSDDTGGDSEESEESAMTGPNHVVWQDDPADDDSEGMFNSVECADEFSFNSLKVAQANIDKLGIEPVWADNMKADMEQQFATCDTWQVPQADKSIREATVSAIPTLVLNGEYDPITPPAWGEQAAKTLSKSYVFIIPASGHGVLETAPCPQGIAHDFLVNPTVKPDSTCIADMSAPLWYVDYAPGN